MAAEAFEKVEPLAPPLGASPGQNAAWWASLSDMQQSRLLREHPGWLGDLNGLPAAVRSKANMELLSGERTRLQAKLKHETGDQSLFQDIAPVPSWVGDAPMPRWLGFLPFVPGVVPHQQRAERLKGKIAELNRLEQTVRQSAGKPEVQRYYLLEVDGHGAGKAVVAEGNPDTAENVATFVPGVGSELADLGDPLGHSHAMKHAAKTAGAGSTSVITWLGYEAPPHIRNAVHTYYADDGKGAFDQFEQGLRAAHEGPASHNVATGHSYGSTLVGHALRDGYPPVDDAVFVGSPGVGVDHASGLNIPPDHVYSTVAEHDIINLTNPPTWPDGHPDPVDPVDPLGPAPTNPDFGGHVFDSDPGHGHWYLGDNSRGAHESYWNPRSAGLRNLGKIISGKPPMRH